MIDISNFNKHSKFVHTYIGHVYIIKCPTTDNVVYVGVTNCMGTRWSGHQTGDAPVAKWIKSIKPLKPIMESIYQDIYWKAERMEKEIIKEYQDMHYILFNRKCGATRIA